MPAFAALGGDVFTEVLIIGGGMAGILCAHFLRAQKIDYILVEGQTVGGGVTQSTTAKITAQHGLIYDKLIKSQGFDAAKQYLELNLRAVSDFRKLCLGIDCDFEDKPAFAYSLTDRLIIEREVSAVKALGFGAELVQEIPLPLSIYGAVKFPRQGQFNPLKFLAGICRDMRIFEHTFVEKIKNNVAYTSRGNITAKKIIVATHFPFINSHGMYFSKMYQHRSYVIALENAPQIGGMYIDEAENGLSFRNYKDLLLVGGGGHRTGKQGGNWQTLRDFARANFPKAQEKYFWATQDCMSLDGVPYIGKYSKNECDIFTATGFNKWGMSASMAAARVLTEMLSGERTNSGVFSPSRSMLKPQLFLNGMETAAGLLSLKPRRCSHLGCALQWNSAEHTWDCPCHGSRFSETGALLDNPAKENIDV